MISVTEAMSLISQHTSLAATKVISIDDLKNEILREDLKADRDYPPFNRVAMDGIAFDLASWNEGNRVFNIEGIQKAGEPQKTLLGKNSCLEVMTGAMLPNGTNCVIRYEDTIIKNEKATLTPEFITKCEFDLKKMQNVHVLGSDYKKGDTLVTEFSSLNSNSWSIAASIGKDKIKISKRPKIALVSTGDELVKVSAKPLAHQIRISNSYAILSSLRHSFFDDVSLFHLSDQKSELVNSLGRIIEDFDMVILSGGVSMGKFDFIPSCLADLNVKEIFHKVRQKPGKPLWFGVTDSGKQVFGLPGNPVSALVCFHRYVLPALNINLGKSESESFRTVTGVLTEKITIKNDLTNFLPVFAKFTKEGMLSLTPLRSNGSGDFNALVGSSGFIEVDGSKQFYDAGSPCTLFLWGQI